MSEQLQTTRETTEQKSGGSVSRIGGALVGAGIGGHVALNGGLGYKGILNNNIEGAIDALDGKLEGDAAKRFAEGNLMETKDKVATILKTKPTAGKVLKVEEEIGPQLRSANYTIAASKAKAEGVAEVTKDALKSAKAVQKEAYAVIREGIKPSSILKSNLTTGQNLKVSAAVVGTAVVGGIVANKIFGGKHTNHVETERAAAPEAAVAGRA